MAKIVDVEGIGEAYAGKLSDAGVATTQQLLECAGIDSVPELAQRRAANLHSKLLEINEQKKLIRRPPAAEQVEAWIALANTLPRKVRH